MSNRTVAESVRVSRAAQHAAEMAAERAYQAQGQARLDRIERAEQRVHRTVQALGMIMAALWLIGLAALVAMEVRF